MFTITLSSAHIIKCKNKHSQICTQFAHKFVCVVADLEGCRAWCGRRPRARHHGDGGRPAGAVWRLPTAAPRADGVAGGRGAGQDQRARRAAGTLQEALHIAYRW